MTYWLAAHRNFSFRSTCHTNEKLMILVTMTLAWRALCLMTQEHETEVKDFFVRKKVNSHDIVFMNTSFCFVFFFFIKKKFSQWDLMIIFVSRGRTNRWNPIVSELLSCKKTIIYGLFCKYYNLLDFINTILLIIYIGKCLNLTTTINRWPYIWMSA